MDEIEVGNVHAKFHRGGTNQIWQAAKTVAFLGRVAALPAEATFAALALARLDDLRGVFAGFERGKRNGGVAIEALEERVHRRWCLGVTVGAGAAGVKRVEGGCAAIAQAPEQAGGVQLEKLVVVQRV